MAKDVPADKAAVLLEGDDAEGRQVKRYLDGPPSFDDTRDLVWMNVVGLRPIILPRLGKLIAS